MLLFLKVISQTNVSKVCYSTKNVSGSNTYLEYHENGSTVNNWEQIGDHNHGHQHTVALYWGLNPNHSKGKLEQLERLRSEDTPRRLMITHPIESY